MHLIQALRMMASKKLLVIFVLAFWAGCQPAQSPKPASDVEIAANPCAAHLHDLAGMLLTYQALKGSFPERLADLKKIDPTLTEAAWRCPKTGTVYGYSLRGVPAPKANANIIVWETQPCLKGVYWVILRVKPNETGAHDLRVAPLPDLPLEITHPSR